MFSKLDREHLYSGQAAGIQHYIVALVLIWTVIILLSGGWQIYRSDQSALDAARSEARASFNKDLVYRRWVTLQGGVYVPISDLTAPNPYLEVPDREVTTLSGETLTLVNPAYMTRQVHELGQEQYGARGHITSLKPIRPENAPDPWETEALKLFEEGTVATSSLETLDGQPVMRYMQVMITEEGCLKCHGDQGYEVGDVRGGISVSVPMQPYWDAQQPIQQGIVLSHAGLWLLGLSGIVFAGRRLITKAQQQESAAQSLKESEQLFRLLTENASDLIYRLQLKPKISFVYVSPAATTMTGYTPEDHYADPELGYKLVHPDDRHILQRVAQDVSDEPITLRWVCKDGSIIWTEQKNRPVYDANGDLIAIEGIARDITARKRMEDELRQSQAYLNGLIQSQTAFLIRTDMVGNYTYINQAFASWYGRGAEELLGTPVLESIELIDHAKTYTTVEACVSQPSTPVQVALAKAMPDGRTRHTLWEFIALQDENNEVTEIQCMGFDITQQRELEDALRRSEARYASAVEASLDAFYLFESVRDTEQKITDFRLVEVNENAAQQMDQSRDLLVNHSLYELFPMTHANGFFERYKQVVETGKPLEEDFYVPEAEVGIGWYHHQIVKVGDGIAIVNRNITRRKQMEETLRNSEMRLKMTLQGTRAGTWEWNVQTGETTFNDRWAEIVGYTLEELAPINIHTWMRLAHPEDLRRSDALLKKHFAGELDYYECEAQMRHKDGHWVWVLDRGSVMEWTADGEPLRMFGTHVDITQRKHAEAALVERYHELDQFFNVALDLLCIADTEGNFIKVNKAWETILGYPVAELEIRQFLDFVHPDDLQATLDAVEQLAHGNQVLNFTNRYRAKDGTYRFIEWRSHPQGQLIYAAARDITERVQMQEALRQSELEFRNLTEKSPDLIVRIDRDSTHLYVNPAFSRAMGLPTEEIIGKTNTDLGVPEEAERELSAIRDQIYETGKATEMELGYPVDGMPRNYHLRLTPELDAEGNVKSIISVSRDVTDRKRAQQHEFDLKLEQERRLLLTSFIQSAAHEFRTPLATINSSAYIMSRSEDAERRIQKAQQVDDQIRRITKLIDMQLMMATLESSQSLSTTAVDISAIIQEVWQEMREEYRSIHDMRQNLSPNLPVVPGNADYLREALKQIMENACRFTPEGGTITLCSQTTGDQVQVEIQDTGPGFPEDVRPHIFKAFWRADTAHRTPGFGLGLPIAQKVIEQHGGDIEVESVVGEGTIFRVMLPTTTRPIDNKDNPYEIKRE